MIAFSSWNYTSGPMTFYADVCHFRSDDGSLKLNRRGFAASSAVAEATVFIIYIPEWVALVL